MTEPLHPLFRDRIESERCPNCGTPGYKDPNGRHVAPFEEWRCPHCDDGKPVGAT